MSTRELVNGGPMQRFIAKILDELIMLAALFPILAILGNSPLTLVLLFMVPLLYHVYTHASIHQATLGEQIMKLRVVTLSGMRLTTRQSLERSLAYAIPTLPAYAALDEKAIMSIMMFLVFAWFMPILLSRNATGMHDILCGCRVVAGRSA